MKDFTAKQAASYLRKCGYEVVLVANNCQHQPLKNQRHDYADGWCVGHDDMMLDLDGLSDRMLIAMALDIWEVKHP